MKMHKTMETELSYQTAFRNSVPRHKDVKSMICENKENKDDSKE